MIRLAFGLLLLLVFIAWVYYAIEQVKESNKEKLDLRRRKSDQLQADQQRARQARQTELDRRIVLVNRFNALLKQVTSKEVWESIDTPVDVMAYSETSVLGKSIKKRRLLVWDSLRVLPLDRSESGLPLCCTYDGKIVDMRQLAISDDDEKDLRTASPTLPKDTDIELLQEVVDALKLYCGTELS